MNALTNSIAQKPKLNRAAANAELVAIAQWWRNNALDEENGGFCGEVDFFSNPVPIANKGVILNSRILWFFSELSRFDNNSQWLLLADRAFRYLMDYFDDKKYGGAYWELDNKGRVINAKKQTYAQCFCIYAYSAYYRTSGNILALQKAKEYFSLVQKHCWDSISGGYIEAFSENWQAIDDYRLSEKDMNVPKSMNTHLHVLEAFGTLHSVSPDTLTEMALRHVIDVFEKHIVDPGSYHLKLFFSKDWQDVSQAYSYGHDIEASWLIWEAAEILGDQALLERLRPLVINMSQVCLDEAMGNKGQVCDEYHFEQGTKSQASYWWVQAEALVGFLNAYKLSGNREFLTVCDGIWAFICQYHLDKNHGEWHWLSSADNNRVSPIYKAGFWKAPYHNGRAMMEVCKLFDFLEGQQQCAS